MYIKNEVKGLSGIVTLDSAFCLKGMQVILFHIVIVLIIRKMSCYSLSMSSARMFGKN